MEVADMYHYSELGQVNTKLMFQKAYEGGYAIPAFNFVSIEQFNESWTL